MKKYKLLISLLVIFIVAGCNKDSNIEKFGPSSGPSKNTPLTTGKIVFYCSFTNISQIDVVLDGKYGTIEYGSTIHEDKYAYCGAQGLATFTIDPSKSHSFSATMPSGLGYYVWQGTIEPSESPCSSYCLNP